MSAPDPAPPALTRRDRANRLADVLLVRMQEMSTWRAAAGILGTLLGHALDPNHLDRAILIGTSAAWVIGLLFPDRLKHGREVRDERTRATDRPQ